MSDAGCLAWPFFDDEHRGYARELGRWASEALPALSVGDDESPDAVCADVARLVAGMGKAGLLRVCAPRAYGGLREGLDVRSLCLARETLARSSGLADFALAMQGLGSAPITLYGREDQKRAFLPRVVAGTAIAAFALSEPEAGSDAAALTATAVRDGDSWRLDGVKTWISNGGLASYYVVFARSGEQPGAKGISAFIVDADAPGLDASERIEVIAPHPLATLRLTGCRVPGDRLLGQPGEGFKIAMGTLDAFRSTVGAAALGFARRALDEASARARARRLFGRTLAEFQLTQAKVGDMATAVDAAALLVYRAAWTRDVLGGRVTREASMAKLFATESAQQVIDAALQVFGGLGVVRGTPVERLYREIRALRIYEGSERGAAADHRVQGARGRLEAPGLDRVGDDDVARRPAREQRVERIARDERQARRAVLAGYPEILPLEYRRRFHAIAPPGAVGALHPDLASDPRVAKEAQVRIAMAADHAVALRARQRGAEDVPGPECDRAPVGPGEDVEVDVLLRGREARDGPGIGPGPGPRLAPSGERALPGAAYQDLSEHRLRVDVKASSELPHAREEEEQRGGRGEPLPVKPWQRARAVHGSFRRAARRRGAGRVR